MYISSDNNGKSLVNKQVLNGIQRLSTGNSMAISMTGDLDPKTILRTTLRCPVSISSGLLGHPAGPWDQMDCP